MVTAITEKKSSEIIWKPLSSDRIDNDRWDRTFYISAIVAITAIVAIIWKQGALIWSWYILNVRIGYSETSIQTVYHYEKALKASDIVWSVSISAVIWSSVLISVTWVELLCAVYKFFRINK